MAVRIINSSLEVNNQEASAIWLKAEEFGVVTRAGASLSRSKLPLLCSFAQTLKPVGLVMTETVMERLLQSCMLSPTGLFCSYNKVKTGTNNLKLYP